MASNPEKDKSSPKPSFFRSKYFTFLIVLLAGVIGYWFAPPDLTTGAYSSEVAIAVDETTLRLDFPFELGQDAGETIAYSQTQEGYALEVQSADSFPYKLGSKISYKARVLDSSGDPIKISLDNAGSTLKGPDYQQFLPPTELSGDWLVFNMRVPYKTKVAMALLLAIVVLWLTETIPLAATALLVPVVIVVAQVTTPKEVMAPFANPIIFLFLAGFLMGEAMRRTGFDRLIAIAILRRTSNRPAILMLAIMGITAFLSMWMSNTASVAIIIPIALAVSENIPNQLAQRGFRKALVLGVAYAGSVGGLGSAIGTPPNMIAMTFLSDYTGASFAFADWFAFGLPMVIMMLPVIWIYLLLTFRVNLGAVGDSVNANIYDQDPEATKGITRAQRIIMIVFIGAMALWLTEGLHHVHSSIVALTAILILFFAEVLRLEDINHINWNALLTFGGGLAIGGVLVATGFSDWVALKLVGLSSFPPLLVIFLVAVLTMVIGAFISNTACAAMLIPLAIPLGQILHIDPCLMVAIVAIGSSIDFALVIGTPPTMLAYSTGIFEIREIFKRGIALDAIGALLLSFVAIWIWKLLGVITF